MVEILEKPLVVNLIGPPSAGKSTTAGEVFTALKRLGVDVEYVTEYAKDLTWEERHVALTCQPYIHGKQLRNQERLHGKVNVIVTDSPLILSAYYTERNCPGKYPRSFTDFVVLNYREGLNTTYFLKRVKPYNPRGRSQSEEESDQIYIELYHFLAKYKIKTSLQDGTPVLWQAIVANTLTQLRSAGIEAPEWPSVSGIASGPLPR